MIFKSALMLVYVATSVSGMVMLKAATAVFSMTFVAGFLLYALSFSMWLVILRLLPLSVAFPLAAGLLIVGSQLAGAALLDETMSATHLLGVLTIMIGIGILFTVQRAAP